MATRTARSRMLLSQTWCRFFVSGPYIDFSAKKEFRERRAWVKGSNRNLKLTKAGNSAKHEKHEKMVRVIKLLHGSGVRMSADPKAARAPDQASMALTPVKRKLAVCRAGKWEMRRQMRNGMQKCGRYVSPGHVHLCCKRTYSDIFMPRSHTLRRGDYAHPSRGPWIWR